MPKRPAGPTVDELFLKAGEAVAARVTLAHAMLAYCRAIARLHPEVRARLTRTLGDLGEAEATGRELLPLTNEQLATLATELLNATDHAEIRRAAHRLLRGQRHPVALLKAYSTGLLVPPDDGPAPAP